MSFKPHLQRVLQPKLLLQMLLLSLINLLHQQLVDLCRLLLIVRLFQSDESGIGVAINHLIALGFDQCARLTYDFMTTQGDGRNQARIEKAATARSRHAV